jgi:hypothetical protein
MGPARRCLGIQKARAGRIANLLSRSTANRWVGLPCAQRVLCAATLALRMALAIGCWSAADLARGQIELPAARPSEPIVVSAEHAKKWRQGQYDVWLLHGNCTIHQGANRCRSRDAVLWVKYGKPLRGKIGEEALDDEQELEDSRHKIIAYLEGDVQIEAGRHEQRVQQPLNPANDRGWLGRFYSTAPIEFRTPPPEPEPPLKPTVYRKALERRNPDDEVIQRTQFLAPEPAAAQPAPVVGTRRLRFFPRSSVNPQFRWVPNEAKDEGVGVFTGGLTVFISSENEEEQLDISADNVVIWTTGVLQGDLQEQFQDDNVPLEVYLEGNVVFRQGDRVIYANRMFYDVNRQNGTIVDSEIFTPAPGYAGMLRLKSELVKVAHGDNFYARNSFVTSSGLGKPRYRVQAGEVFIEDHQRPVVNPLTGTPVLDPATHQPVIEHEQLVTSKNNFLFIGPVPVFYWPRFSTNLDQPSTFITSAFFQNDKVFGTWTEVELNSFQLLGIRNVPKGLHWTFTLSNLSKRGFAAGTDVIFNQPSFLGGGPVTSNLQIWGLHDKGFDNLGRTRNHLAPEIASRNRGRLLENYRQQLAGNFQLTGQIGYITDRNFLEQYYEAEWDQRPDELTDLELKRIIDNRSWSVYTSARLNPFFTETQWWPRADHFTLGQELLGDRLTWYEHSNAGYASYRITNVPTDPADAAIFQYLPWEKNTSGLPSNFRGSQLVTAHEIDAPFDLGPFKFSPYAMGQLAHWDQDLSYQQYNRAWGQAGLRGSIAFWASNPTIESRFLNVHGLAHKAVFEVDASASDANKRMTMLPLYDPINDNAQEHFQRRFMVMDYGGVLPYKYDPRSYALRSGLQNYVSSPVSEVADRFESVRFGLNQRWQTKRGPAGNRRIIDWIVLDAGGVYFPNSGRDNFGQPFGLVNYDFRWHVGDRVTMLSDGLFDFFSQGQRIFSVGTTIQQPPRMNWNVSFRSFNGPFTYNMVTLSNSYTLSPKWRVTWGTSFALNSYNIGQNISVTRVGESFVTSAAFYVDNSKANNGFNLMITPRFLGPQMLRRLGGANVPMSNQYGLE